MKTTKCSLCGRDFSISDETVFDQHVLCPYCGGKFSYLADSPEFSLERLTYALAECRKDAESDRYYTAAPAGARLYIGLLFYGKVFKDRMNHDLYLAEMAEIENEMKSADWAYLLENEDDAELADYFRSKLPEGFARKATKKIVRQTYERPSQGVLRSQNTESAPEEKTPHIIHLSEKGKDVHEDPYAQRKMKMSEDKARFYEELKTQETRRKALRNIVSIVTILGLVVTGTFVYVHLDRQRVEAKKAELDLECRKAAERTKQEELDRQQREKSEEESRLNREKRNAEEKARAERMRLERETKERKVRLEREAAERKIRENREYYRQMLSSYEDGRLDLLPAAAADGLPVRKDGVYCYLLPYNESAMPALTVCTVTNGIQTAFRLTENGERTAEEGQAFLSRIADRDYLVSSCDRVWFHSNRKKPHVGNLPKDRVVSLKDEFFGDLAKEVTGLGLEFNDLEFEIVFIPKEKKKGRQQIIIAQVVDCGAAYSMECVRDAVEEYFANADLNGKGTSATFSTAKKRRFKRTIQFCDGEHIKKGVDGVTYVPRTPPNSAYYSSGSGIVIRDGRWNGYSTWRNESRRASRAAHNMDRWQSLADQARKEDEEENAYYEKQRQIRSENEARRQNEQKQNFERKVSEIMDQGSLFWRARLKWKQKPSRSN